MALRWAHGLWPVFDRLQCRVLWVEWRFPASWRDRCASCFSRAARSRWCAGKAMESPTACRRRRSPRRCAGERGSIQRLDFHQRVGVRRPAPSTAEDLKDMGIGIVGHRRTLLDAIAAARPRARRDRGGAGGRGAAAAGRLRAAHMLAARCSQGGSVGSGNSAQPPLGPQPRASATSSTARSTPLWPPERLSTPPRTCRFVCNANLRCGTRTGQTPTRLLRPACRPTVSRRSFWSQVISAGSGQRT
jgi:hypothetical protein